MRRDASGWLATVRRTEDGFFTAKTEPTVNLGSEFSVGSIAGLPSTTQVFRTHVELDGVAPGHVEVWVVCTAPPIGSGKPPPGSSSFDQVKLLQVRRCAH
jgi:hypothetical protein